MFFIIKKNSNYFSRYDPSKLSRIIGFLWEGKTKTSKKDYFIQNLPPPTFFKQSSLNFYSLIFIQLQKMLLWKKDFF